MSTVPITPIEIKLDDGTVAKGATWEEVATNLAKMKVDTATAYKTEKERADTASLELEQIRSKEAEAQRATAADAERKRQEAVRASGGKVFDRQKYYQLLNSEDPEEVAKAGDLWFEHRFGQKPEEAQQQFAYTGEKIQQYEQERVAGIFLATHSDYPQGDGKAAKALREQTETLLTQGYPYDAGTLHLAYSNAIAAGQIKPVEKKPDTKADDNKPNPTLSGTGAGGSAADDANDEARLWSLPMDQLEAELKRRGALK